MSVIRSRHKPREGFIPPTPEEIKDVGDIYDYVNGRFVPNRTPCDAKINGSACAAEGGYDVNVTDHTRKAGGAVLAMLCHYHKRMADDGLKPSPNGRPTMVGKIRIDN